MQYLSHFFIINNIFLNLAGVGVGVGIIFAGYLLAFARNPNAKKDFLFGITFFSCNNFVEFSELINSIALYLNINYIVNCFLLFVPLIIAIIFFASSNKEVSVYYPRSSSIIMYGDAGMVPPPQDNLIQKTIKVVKEALGQGEVTNANSEQSTNWSKWFFWLIGFSLIGFCAYKWGGFTIDWLSGKFGFKTSSSSFSNQNYNIYFTDIKMLKTKEIKDFRFSRSPISFEVLRDKRFFNYILHHQNALNIQSRDFFLLNKQNNHLVIKTSLNQFKCGAFIPFNEANFNYIKNTHLSKVNSFTSNLKFNNAQLRVLKMGLSYHNIYPDEYQLVFNTQFRYVAFLKELGLAPIVDSNENVITVRRGFLGPKNKKYIQECFILLYDRNADTVKVLFEYSGIGNLHVAENLEKFITFYLENATFFEEPKDENNPGKLPCSLYIIDSELLEDVLLRKDLVNVSETMNFEEFKKKLKLQLIMEKTNI